MTKGCVVPKCKTGYKSVKQKCSVFRVPKNIERYKKWQAAIPGVILKQTQYVCEKHFEEKYIVRKWIKRDADGRIIAESPYQIPRLEESAVPTIFDGDKTMKQSAPVESAASIISGSNETMHQSALDNSIGPVKLESSQVMQQFAPSDIPENTVSLTKNILGGTKFPEFPGASIGGPSTDGIDAESGHEPEIILSQQFIRSENIAVQASDICVARREKYFDITIYDLQSNRLISIPSGWCFEESLTKKGRRIVFLHSVMKQENGVEIPMLERSVVVDTDRTLRYCVHGRAVTNPDGCKLAKILKDTEQLPTILEKFKNMNVCGGLGAVNIHHLPVDIALKDSVDQWRLNECSLLSKQKRCVACMKMRQRLSKRESRSKENHSVKRVLRASNPIDQKKILALQKKISSERRLKNRAKLREKLLRQSLGDAAAEIASIRAETLDETSASLNVPPAQKKQLPRK